MDYANSRWADSADTCLAPSNTAAWGDSRRKHARMCREPTRATACWVNLDLGPLTQRTGRGLLDSYTEAG